MRASSWFGIALLVLAGGALSLGAGLPVRALDMRDGHSRAVPRLADSTAECRPTVLA